MVQKQIFSMITRHYYYHYYLFLTCSACCYYSHFFYYASHNKPKTNRILSSLHFQYFSQYSCSSQQCTLLHYSNIACHSQPSHPPIKFCRNISKGHYHYRDNFYISQFPQSFDLLFQILPLFHFFFFFLCSYIRWYSNISNYPPLFFLINNYQVRLSSLYQIFTLDIFAPQ